MPDASRTNRRRAPAAGAGGAQAVRVPLSAQRIRAAALALVDADGVEALSMRRLAAVLAVDPMSIYHHVPNKQALLQSVYDRVLEELPVPHAAPDGWQHALRDLARRFYRLARRHPQVMPGLIASRWGTRREREIHAAIDQLLAAEGFAAPDRARIVGAIYTYATGLAGLAAHGLGSRPLYDPAAEGAAGPAADVRSRGTEEDVDFSIDLMIAGIESLARGRSSGAGAPSGSAPGSASGTPSSAPSGAPSGTPRAPAG
ncbi:MAG TPA: TetR family transcriptional regulator [Quisquiliibacterium sp.]|nr:MAG: TetR family transcriptional regulator [Burkholderiaceae bacterium]HPA89205.1 TetR family transcriptional regulator [Quisquiliibacterium sp.]HQP67569.1 TetR family transcriptional regulator [Quisquiliibacterium sp.]